MLKALDKPCEKTKPSINRFEGGGGLYGMPTGSLPNKWPCHSHLSKLRTAHKDYKETTMYT